MVLVLVNYNPEVLDMFLKIVTICLGRFDSEILKGRFDPEN